MAFDNATEFRPAAPNMWRCVWVIAENPRSATFCRSRCLTKSGRYSCQLTFVLQRVLLLARRVLHRIARRFPAERFPAELFPSERFPNDQRPPLQLLAFHRPDDPPANRNGHFVPPMRRCRQSETPSPARSREVLSREIPSKDLPATSQNQKSCFRNSSSPSARAPTRPR
jgi:hypothetical protein